MSETLIIVGDAPDDAVPSAEATGFEVIALKPDEVLSKINVTPDDATVLLTGEMENRSDLVAAIASVRKLRGSGADAIRAVRDPAVLPSLPPFEGLRFCKTLPRVNAWQRLVRKVSSRFSSGRVYLVKPVVSYGGRGIRPWVSGMHVSPDEYVQQAITGTPMSAVYRSDGWSAVLLGVTEQLVGDECFGAGWYEYCGSIGPVVLDDRDRAALSHLGVVLSQRCDLRGVFGVDLVRDAAGKWWPVEVNPRWPGSAWVLEQAGAAVMLSMDQTRGGTALPDHEGVKHGVAWRVEDGARVGRVTASGVDREACYAALVEAVKTNESVGEDDADGESGTVASDRGTPEDETTDTGAAGHAGS